MDRSGGSARAPSEAELKHGDLLVGESLFAFDMVDHPLDQRVLVEQIVDCFSHLGGHGRLHRRDLRAMSADVPLGGCGLPSSN